MNEAITKTWIIFPMNCDELHTVYVASLCKLIRANIEPIDALDKHCTENPGIKFALAVCSTYAVAKQIINVTRTKMQ